MATNYLLLWQLVLFTAALWSGWFRGRAVVRGRYHPLNVVTVVHAWFSAASVVMEWVWGTPNYRIYTHLIAINDSKSTWLAYYAFSSILCLVFSLTAKHLDKGRFADFDRRCTEPRFWTSSRGRIVLWVGLMSPVFCALFTPDLRIWTHYAAPLELQPNAEYTTFFNALYSTTYVAILSACGLILASHIHIKQLVPIGLFTAESVWLNGKRNSVILAMVLILFSCRMRGIISRRSTYVLFGVAVLAFIGYSEWYQSQYRPILSSFDTFYESARMDFVRDADVRIALFAELEDAASPILEYRGQSVLFDALFFVPRSLWENKPNPYYFYITSTAVGGPRVYRTWGIETTILGEAIANFGPAGLIIGPLFLITIAAVGYRPNNPFLNLFTCVICTLFMSIQLAGFPVLWSAWCFLVASNLPGRVRHRDSRWVMVQ